MADVIFRHPQLDFATTHFYDAKTINYPKDTVKSAICTGALVREALEHLHQPKPFFDSEHGPIHSFKDLHKTLPEAFDDEYFRHIQWAHVASGAAGGGMRWPNRHPHVLTHGMRVAQQNLASFMQLIDWSNFNRKNLNQEIQITSKEFVGFACSSEDQAVAWILRQSKFTKMGTLDRTIEPTAVTISIPGLKEGAYSIYFWDTLEGYIINQQTVYTDNTTLTILVQDVLTDLAIAIKKS